MIILGYQGIGKSSIVNKDSRFVDLDSSLFSYNDEKIPHWAHIYANVAISLSKQNKIVFVSTHKLVRELIKKSNEKVILVYPNISIKNEWIARLKTRYNKTKNETDLNAYTRAVGYFEQDIAALSKEPYEKIRLETMGYNLYNLLKYRINN